MAYANHITLMARYHKWATETILQSIAVLKEKDFDADLKLAYRSIHGTLVHLYYGDQLWFRRMKGDDSSHLAHFWQQPSYEAAAALFENAHSRSEIQTLLVSQCQAWIAFIDEICASDACKFEQNFDYITTSGERKSQAYGTMMLHVFNHGTHHRGQISAALTALDQPPPNMDLPYMNAN